MSAARAAVAVVAAGIALLIGAAWWTSHRLDRRYPHLSRTALRERDEEDQF